MNKHNFIILVLTFVALAIGVAGGFAGADIQRCADAPKVAMLEKQLADANRYATDWQGVADHYKFYLDKFADDNQKAKAEIINLIGVYAELQKERDIYYHELHECLNSPVPVKVNTVEIEKAIYPQRFDDVETAREWVLSHRLPIVIIADKPDNLIRTYQDPRYDCDDYADDYEALAILENISLWQAPVTDGYIWGAKVSPEKGNHIGLWTKINDTYYYIEPQPVEDKWRFVRIARAD